MHHKTLLKVHLSSQHARILRLLLWPQRPEQSQELAEFVHQNQDFRQLEGPVRKILPLLCPQIQASFPESDLAKSANLHLKSAWMRMQAMYLQASRLAQELERQGIRSLFFKGTSLAHLHYTSKQVRLMADIDILVPYEQREQACQICFDLGYRLQFDDPFDFRLETEQEATLVGPQGVNLDLHWTLRTEELDDRVLLRRFQDQLFARAQPFTMFQVPCWSLGNEDLFVNLCTRGYYCRRQISLQWIVDSGTLWNSCGWSWEATDPADSKSAQTSRQDPIPGSSNSSSPSNLGSLSTNSGNRSNGSNGNCRGKRPDWPLIVQIAKDSQVTIPFEHSLSILESIGFPIPSWVRQQLRQHPVPWWRPYEVRYLGVPGSQLRWWQRAFLIYPIYRRQQKKRGFLEFFSAYWGQNGLFPLLQLAWKKLWQPGAIFTTPGNSNSQSNPG